MLVAGTATFRGGPGAMPPISGDLRRMSLLEKIDPPEADEIEPGKRLIRVGGGHGASLGEQLSSLLHRLSWRTPFHALRLRGRHPLKLLAVPKDPVAGDKAAGEAILARPLRPPRRDASRSMTLDFNDPGLPARSSPTICRASNGCATSPPRQPASGAPRWPRSSSSKWLAAHADTVGERAWRADLWGRRILFWTAYAPYILSSRDSAYRSVLLNTLARGARHLDKAADKARPGLARITAWAGVIAAALVVQGGPARLGRGEAGLLRALAASLHDDGGLVSRSPAEQLRLVELLAQLSAVYYRRRARHARGGGGGLVRRGRRLARSHARRRGAVELAGRQHGGRSAGSPPRSRAAECAPARCASRAAGAISGSRRRAPSLLFDAAPPPPTRAFAGGCASTLAFELSEGPNRLVVNCGGAGARAGRGPGRAGPRAADAPPRIRP